MSRLGWGDEGVGGGGGVVWGWDGGVLAVLGIGIWVGLGLMFN